MIAAWEAEPNVGETASHIFQLWLDEQNERQRLSDKHLSNRQYAWRAIEPWFGHLSPEHITHRLCRQFTAAQQAKGLSNATIRQQLIALKTVLRWYDPQTPARFELPPPPPPRDRHLSHKEAEALLAEAQQTPHLYLFCVLALTTAARTTALLDLRWQQVQLGRGRIDFGRSASTKRRAIVPMNETAREALVAAREAALTDYVIEFNGRPVKDIKRAFHKAAMRAGLEDVTPHTLRHTAAVWMAESGVRMEKISTYLGHTSTAITESTYAKFAPDYLRDAADSLELGARSELARRRKKRGA